MRLFFICVLLSASFVLAYTAQPYDSVDLILNGSYTAQPYNSVDLVLSDVPILDTCTYTSGDWEIDCSDNCSISSNVELGGNDISIIGTGTFVTTGNITGYSKLHIEGTDSSNICRVTCKDGACFEEW